MTLFWIPEGFSFGARRGLSAVSIFIRSRHRTCATARRAARRWAPCCRWSGPRPFSHLGSVGPRTPRDRDLVFFFPDPNPDQVWCGLVRSLLRCQFLNLCTCFPEGMCILWVSLSSPSDPGASQCTSREQDDPCWEYLKLVSLYETLLSPCMSKK